MAKKKRKSMDPLAGDRTPVGQLYRAVRRYVNSHGGSIVVIGGIQVLEWPSDPKYSFSVSVRCLGRKPSYADRAAALIPRLTRKRRSLGKSDAP